MIEQELVLLGLLKEGPKHGYEIKKAIRDILFLFAGVDLTSIYYPLRVMEHKGLLVKQRCREGKRPHRQVYALTPKGEERFYELLNRSFLDFKRPQFSLDVSLFFLSHLPQSVAVRRLRARQVILHKISKGLNQLIASLRTQGKQSFLPILEHNLSQLESESLFLHTLTRTYPSSR
jgi:DNA-binding PadR family transcriptional regulator